MANMILNNVAGDLTLYSLDDNTVYIPFSSSTNFAPWAQQGRRQQNFQLITGKRYKQRMPFDDADTVFNWRGVLTSDAQFLALQGLWESEIDPIGFSIGGKFPRRYKVTFDDWGAQPIDATNYDYRIQLSALERLDNSDNF